MTAALHLDKTTINPSFYTSCKNKNNTMTFLLSYFLSEPRVSVYTTKKNDDLKTCIQKLSWPELKSIVRVKEFVS